jgi:hypothetical protein
MIEMAKALSEFSVISEKEKTGDIDRRQLLAPHHSDLLRTQNPQIALLKTRVLRPYL